MSNTLTIRLPEELAEWLAEKSRKSGLPQGRIVRNELERARNSGKRDFMRLAGGVDGPSDLSQRRGFSTAPRSASAPAPARSRRRRA